MQFKGMDISIQAWCGQNLGKVIAIDTETTRTDFITTPDLVTMQAFAGGNVAYFIPRDRVKDFLSVHVASTFVFQNAPFDIDVIKKHLQDNFNEYSLYDQGQIHDVGILYRLLHIATAGLSTFKYSLDLIVEKMIGVKLSKDEDVRLNFDQFLHIAPLEMPLAFQEYALLDVVATYYTYWEILSRIERHDTCKTLLSHDFQVKGDLALNRIYKRGIGFDVASKDSWLSGIDSQLDLQKNILATYGLVKGSKGIKSRYESIMTLMGLAPYLPRTKEGDLTEAYDDLIAFAGNPFVDAFLKYAELKKVSDFVRKIDINRAHPRYQLIVDTGRTSCSGPNIQNMPREGGVRELFVPKEGHLFVDVDYSGLELAVLSQVAYQMYGESVMRDKINEGQDLHRYYASVLYGIEESQVTKSQRQSAKAANFGFPGGLGIDTFREFSLGYGLTIPESEARRMKEAWFQAFPEMRQYLRDNEEGDVYTLTGRKKANATYCSAANYRFQGLAADGAKLALYELDKQGFDTVAFVHDQMLVEVPAAQATASLSEVSRIMKSSMELVTPDVSIATEGQILKRWSK